MRAISAAARFGRQVDHADPGTAKQPIPLHAVQHARQRGELFRWHRRFLYARRWCYGWRTGKEFLLAGTRRDGARIAESMLRRFRTLRPPARAR
jgi:hypothetical protein